MLQQPMAFPEGVVVPRVQIAPVLACSGPGAALVLHRCSVQQAAQTGGREAAAEVALMLQPVCMWCTLPLLARVQLFAAAVQRHATEQLHAANAQQQAELTASKAAVAAAISDILQHQQQEKQLQQHLHTIGSGPGAEASSSGAPVRLSIYLPAVCLVAAVPDAKAQQPKYFAVEAAGSSSQLLASMGGRLGNQQPQVWRGRAAAWWMGCCEMGESCLPPPVVLRWSQPPCLPDLPCRRTRPACPLPACRPCLQACTNRGCSQRWCCAGPVAAAAAVTAAVAAAASAVVAAAAAAASTAAATPPLRNPRGRARCVQARWRCMRWATLGLATWATLCLATPWQPRRSRALLARARGARAGSAFKAAGSSLACLSRWTSWSGCGLPRARSRVRGRGGCGVGGRASSGLQPGHAHLPPSTLRTIDLPAVLLPPPCLPPTNIALQAAPASLRRCGSGCAVARRCWSPPPSTPPCA